jgi:hypothetical protein
MNNGSYQPVRPLPAAAASLLSGPLSSCRATTMARNSPWTAAVVQPLARNCHLRYGRRSRSFLERGLVLLRPRAKSNLVAFPNVKIRRTEFGLPEVHRGSSQPVRQGRFAFLLVAETGDL